MAKTILTPANARPELSIAVIDDLKAKGFTQSDIARMFGVTRQAISWHKHTYNGRLTPRETVHLHWPWQVSSDHTRNSVYRRMRDHGEFMATGGRGMAFDARSRLRGFYKRLRDERVVVEFDPEIPPIPGFALYGGFALRHRLESDGDLLIRVNEHTTLTEDGRLIWRFPPEDPQLLS